MRQINTLKINPRVTVQHYMYYFNVSRTTAWRMMSADKILLNKHRLTYFDFFTLNDAFPDAKFNPVWVSINCPQKVSLGFKNTALFQANV